VTDISSRKQDHIDLCATGDVGFHEKSTLLGEVEFIHDALPELSLDDLDTSVTVLGKRLRAPLLIAAMTGGTTKARDINRGLAQIAQERGYAFGLGSQRAMLRGPVDDTYVVRDVAPSVLLLGNLGAVQAKELPSAAVAELAKKVGADAMCIHLNPAMELVQPGGDRDFGGVVATLERLVHELDVPIIAKETGCGIGRRAAKKIVRAGVDHVDVSGAGGTSWVAVETARASAGARALGEALREWGVPTAASIAICRKNKPHFETIFATGGVASGLDVACALALGASAAGIARPVLQAFTAGGRDAANAFLDGVEAELRAVMLLVGAKNVRALRKADRIVGPRLRAWIKTGIKKGKKARHPRK
jgi:isopentenyl-diphosphate delta-isomerase